MFYLDGNLLCFIWLAVLVNWKHLIFPAMFIMAILTVAACVAFFKALATNELQRRSLTTDVQEAKRFRFFLFFDFFIGRCSFRWNGMKTIEK